MKSIKLLEFVGRRTIAAAGAAVFASLFAFQHTLRAQPMSEMAQQHGMMMANDTRKPLKLTPMMAEHQKQKMREHLVAVQEILSALSTDDFTNVARAAKKLGSSPEMDRTCNLMGAQTPGFTPMALNFHRTADTITAAAIRHNRSAVLAALGNTLADCTGCHATFKQQLVER